MNIIKRVNYYDTNPKDNAKRVVGVKNIPVYKQVNNEKG